eukprot:COSAG05_NODE_2619_length_2831_cov_3.448023_2_plen_357_part_00
MPTLRQNRTLTNFFDPSPSTQVHETSTRGRLWNPLTRRWIRDTPQNRLRIQPQPVGLQRFFTTLGTARPPIAKIRNPRTGRLVKATARNIRAAERFRTQRVQEMIQRRAATRIAQITRRFLERPSTAVFDFRETSDEFQTATLAFQGPLAITNANKRAFISAMEGAPSYHSIRLIQTYKFRDDAGETRTLSTKITHLDNPENPEGLWRRAVDLLEDLARKQENMDYVLEVLHGEFNFAVTSGSKCESKDDVPAYLLKKKSIIKIYNSDNLCGQRALVLGLLHDNLKKRKHLCEISRAKTFTKEAQKLAKEIMHNTSMTFNDFNKFTDKFPDYSVWIWNAVNEASFSCGDGDQHINV